MKAADGRSWRREAAAVHREADLALRTFPFYRDGQGHNFMASVGTARAGDISPAHRHNFSQVRYLLSGSSGYGSLTMHAGDCGYFPESVEYGPQRQTEPAESLTLQFPGESGAYYMTPDELRDTAAKLRVADPRFGRDGVGYDHGGRKRDSFELVWEALRSHPVAYAPPRYVLPIIMRPRHFEWREDAHGRETRCLGAFGDAGVRISIVRIRGEAPLGLAPTRSSEFWFLLDGGLRLDDRDYAVRSGFLLERDDAPPLARGEIAEFLVVQLPERPRQPG